MVAPSVGFAGDSVCIQDGPMAGVAAGRAGKTPRAFDGGFHP